jgi:serine/threonine protein kinase
MNKLAARVSSACSGGKLGLPAALAIAQNIAKGLEELHHLGVVMLDIKPDNVLLTRRNTAVLTDFGISREVTGTIGCAQQTQVAGTFNYM